MTPKPPAQPSGSTDQNDEPPGDSIAVEIVTAVSNKSNTPIEALPPFSKAINPDALDELFQCKGEEETLNVVKFEYAGFEVTLTGNGEYSVIPLADAHSNPNNS